MLFISVVLEGPLVVTATLLLQLAGAAVSQPAQPLQIQYKPQEGSDFAAVSLCRAMKSCCSAVEDLGGKARGLIILSEGRNLTNSFKGFK